MNLFEYTFMLLSVLFMLSFFYKTCTPDNKHKTFIENTLYRLSIIFWGCWDYLYSAIKWSVFSIKWTFNFLIQNTYHLIMIVIVLYIIYFPLNTFEFLPGYPIFDDDNIIINDDSITFIVNVATLLGFYALLETRREQRKN